MHDNIEPTSRGTATSRRSGWVDEDTLGPENRKASLDAKSVRGGLFTMTSQGVSFVLTTFRTMVLARLLAPADFGLIAMVTVVVNFAATFKDAGLSMATVQKDTITHQQISTLFWINVVISAVLGLGILVSSPVVAWFYQKPELTAVTAALSISFFVSGLSIQHAALLRRRMRFGSLAAVHIATQVISLAATIMLAVKGWRHWALVGGALTGACCSPVLTYLACPWVPGRIHRGTGVRDMLVFGGHLTAFNFLNYFTRNLDNVLIGKFLGSDALGLYSKAYQIVYVPLVNVRNPINAVAIPALSALKEDPKRFRHYYARIVFALALLSMPLMAWCVVFAREVILVVLGGQWLGMMGAFRLLALAGFIQPVTGTRGALLVAVGQTRLYFWLGAISAALTVTGFCIGIYWGIVGVAASYVVVIYAQQYPMFRIAFRYVPVSIRELVGNCWHVAAFSWISALTAKVILSVVPALNAPPLLWGSLIMGVMFFTLFMGMPTTRRSFLESLAVLKKGFRSG